jgi:hypothetical protein
LGVDVEGVVDLPSNRPRAEKIAGEPGLAFPGPGEVEGNGHYLGLEVRWSRRWGWIELKDPFTGEWLEVRAEECPEWYRRAASVQQNRRGQLRDGLAINPA